LESTDARSPGVPPPYCDGLKASDVELATEPSGALPSLGLFWLRVGLRGAFDLELLGVAVFVGAVVFVIVINGDLPGDAGRACSSANVRALKMSSTAKSSPHPRHRCRSASARCRVPPKVANEWCRSSVVRGMRNTSATASSSRSGVCALGGAGERCGGVGVDVVIASRGTSGDVGGDEFVDGGWR
jgi:hypothetical protein